MSSDISENIKVYIRQRPVISSDIATSEGQTKSSGIDGFSKDYTKCSYYSATSGMTQEFKADRIFANMSYQDSLYDEIARPLVESALLGYSGTIVAYGPTCSGKTFTMRGGPGEDRGIMPRCIEQLLGNTSSGNVSIWASYVQIYCESVSDLLTSSSPSDGEKQLSIREKNGQVFVEGLSKFPVTSVDDLWILLSRGDENRNTASTNMNETSSRSHAALIIQVIIKDDSSTTSSSTAGTHRESTLMLVDLAGSERASASDGRDYMRLEEAKAINLSLSALGNCMSALAEGRGHIPYRDSKLTRLLQGCLGGTSRTSVIVNIPPGEDAQGETLSALRFASRASKVKVMAKVNRIKDYEAMYLEAKKTLDMLGKTTQGVENTAKDELLKKKDQQIEDLTTEVESLKKQLQVFQIGSKYTDLSAGSSASGKSIGNGTMDNAAWTEKLNELTARHAQEIASMTRLHQMKINQMKENERQLAREISDLHDDNKRDKQALLTAVQEQRQSQEKRIKSETHLKARIEELLTELNDRRSLNESLQEILDALHTKHNETLAQLKQAQEAMYDMVTKDQVKEMESLFLDTVTKLSTRVNFLEKAKKASNILTEGEFQMQQQQQQQHYAQQSTHYQPITTSSNGNSRVRIEPGGKIRTSSLSTLNPNSSGKG